MKTPLVLTYSKPKNIVLLLLSLGFIYLGIFNVQQGSTLIGIFSIVFFGLCLVVSIINFIPKASRIVLKEEGLEMTSLFKTRILPWAAVNNFEPGWLVINRTVYFELNDEAMQVAKTKIKRGALPDTYGMSAKKLASLLNEYKNYYTQ